MSERRDNFKKWLDGGIGYTLKNDDINYIMDFVDELFNINDKLSSAIESTEQRIDKALGFIDMIYEIVSYSKSTGLDDEEVKELYSILKGKDVK